MLFSPDALRVSRVLRTFTGLALMASAVAVSGCDDDDDFLIPDPLEGVATFKNDAINFGAMRTFAMPDTVVHVLPATGTPVAVPRDLDHVLLNEVRANFLARGYTQVNPATTQPDFVVLVSATASQKYQAFVNYSWYSYWGFYDWSWYAPGFSSAWGVNYPWRPAVATVEYNRGTVVVDLIPTLSVNPLDQTVSSAWAGVGTGVMDGSLTADIVIAAVDRMFELSPYLRPVGASAARRTPEMGTKFKSVDALLNR